MERRTFHAMGTEVELLVEADDADEALAAAEAEFHRLESLLSRFRRDSELSQLNATGSIEPGPDLRRVVELALAGREETGGRFDPTVHDAVVAAGYDRSFEQLPEAPLVAGPARCGGGVRLDDRIELEPGVRLDLGGIGKGYAAERAAELLSLAGSCLVNAGGDVSVRGGTWPVGCSADLTLELGRGGLATSGVDRRRWRADGRELHHIVDPATGAPAETDLLRVTVVAADTVDAEIWAKALLLVGAEAAAAEADARSLPAVLVTADNRTTSVGGLS
jgi:FAD:protein FMN transferase